MDTYENFATNQDSNCTLDSFGLDSDGELNSFSFEVMSDEFVMENHY